MRPIRFIFVMLAIGAALVMVLLRPLPGRAAVRAGHHPRSKKTKLRRGQHVLPKVPRRSEMVGRRIVHYAKHFLGVRYSYGGTSPRTGFDCSGFVRFVYSHFGISLPHSSFADLWHGQHISRGRLRPGDLVFFDDASHVGIYVGGGSFIDSPHSGAVVRISTLHWYGGTYYGARRLGGA